MKWKELKEKVENTASKGGRKGDRRDRTREEKERIKEAILQFNQI